MAGELEVDDNEAESTYIVQSGGTATGGISTSADQITIPHNFRGYLANKCATEFAPDIFKSYNFLDKTIIFTADLSDVPCACNAAFYLVTMPAYNSSQMLDPTVCNDYYCDANKVCGIYCPEMDLFEANSYALQVAPHKCDPIEGNYYPTCDGGGCAINTYKRDNTSFGPGTSFIINTLLPFQVAMSFITTNGQLSTISTVLSQGSSTFSFTHDDTHCPSGYLAALTEPFKSGMVPVFSYWGNTGDSMSWLDSPPCDITTACDTTTHAVFGQLRITGNTGFSLQIMWLGVLVNMLLLKYL